MYFDNTDSILLDANIWKIAKPDVNTLEIYLNAVLATRIVFPESMYFGGCDTQMRKEVAYFSVWNMAVIPNQYLLTIAIDTNSKLI